MVGTVRGMTTQLTGKASFTSWDEEPGFDSGAPVPRLARATVEFQYEGDLVGTSTCHLAMHYAGEHEGTAVGYERLEVRTGDGLEGTIVLRSACEFDGEGVDTTWTVVPGSGTGALAGVEGSGGYHAPPQSTSWAWRLDREG
jgi:hypothetical protein